MSSARKRSLLLQLLNKRSASTEQALPRVQRRDRNTDLPLSFFQEGLWFLDQLAPNAAAYNISVSLRLAGELRVEALEQALRDVTVRHEALRTRFAAGPDGPRQLIEPEVRVDVKLDDLTGLPAARRDEQLRAETHREAGTGFDLSAVPLLRCRLLKLAPLEHVLLFSVHHIVFDGWSSSILISELAHAYERRVAGTAGGMPELEVQYADFALWQRQWLSGEKLDTCLNYWRRHLAGLPALTLPWDHQRPPVPSYRGGAEPVRFPAASYARVMALANERADTPFMVMLTAFMVLLHRYSNQDQVVLGAPVANRIRPEIEPLIGYFVNTLVLRADFSGAPDFFTALLRVREMCLEAYAHQEMPLEKLVEDLRPERRPGSNPLFQVTFTWQNEATDLPELSGVKMEPLPAFSGVCKFDLSLLLFPRRGGALAGMLEYATDLFEAATIQRMVRHYGQLVENVILHPERPVSQISFLSAGEREQLLFGWGRNEAIQPAENVCELFERQAQQTPNHPAIHFLDQQISYRELNERANQMAHYLCSCGIGAETRVGVFMDRGIENVVATCAILKAGGAYVPLDLSYPSERLRFLLEDGAVPVVLTTRALRDRLPVSWARIIEVDGERDEIEGHPRLNLMLNIDPLQSAYLMYTSGSTGIPKGIEIPHQGIVRLVHDCKYVVFGQGDRVAQVANSSFDAFTFEIWGALLNGGTIVAIKRDMTLSPKDFAAAIGELKISKMFLTASLFNLVAREAPGAFRGVDDLLVGGEALNPHWVRRVLQHGPPKRFLNGYGPTENTTFSSYYVVEDVGDHAASIPIGRPVGNSCLWVLDRELEPVPPGVTGELYVAGAGLARGYWNRPELTAERFLPNPFQDPGQRMYRTGDLARWSGEGFVEFQGRNDEQVKIRGFRIEPGEIESILAQHSSVRQAIVVVREHQPGEKRLVAYVAGDATEDELRDALRQRLPEYMVPAEFILMEALPLTPNGKLDQQALPSVPQPITIEDVPASPLQQLLAGIWKQVLAREMVSASDNFFELGGHSLLATQVAARAAAVFGVEVDLRLIFQLPVLRDLAQAIDDLRRSAPTDRTPAITSVGRETALPASFAQQRLWFIDQLEPGSAAYNIPACVRIHGRLQEEALAQALDELVRRHEVLRTFFFVEDSVVKCRSEPASGIAGLLAREDLTRLPQQQRVEAARRKMEQETAAGFALGSAPLLRARLFCMNDDHSEHVLLLVMHHIVSDGWSIAIFIRELAALYDAFSAGKTPRLPDLPIQYADFAAWQRNWLTGDVLERQIGYWKTQLADVSVLDLSFGKPRPEILGHRGAARPLRFSPALAGRLHALCRSEGVTLFMLLLAAAQILLARWSGQNDVAVGSPVANRNRTEVEGLIGFFVNTLVLRVDLSGDPTVRELLARVREACLSAYAHQDVPFERLVEELRPERDLGRTPLFQVMVALQNAPREKISLSEETRCELVAQEIDIAKYELDFSFQEVNDRLEGLIVFNTSLFDADTMAAFVAGYEGILEALPASVETHLSQLSAVPAAQLQILREWQGRAEPFPRDRCIHQLIMEQASRTPDSVAIMRGNRQITYSEMIEAASRLALHLQHEGIRSEIRVGLYLGRDIEMVIAMLAVLMAGGAYVPLDPSHPPDRIRYILDDSDAEFVITQTALLDHFPGHKRTIVLDQEWEEIQKLQGPFSCQPVEPENLAYVIYTSGSTGRPKGVAIQHSSTVAMFAWARRVFSAEELHRVLASTSICFDLAVFEIFVPLAAGGSVAVAENLLDVPQLDASSPTLVNTVPSAAAELLRMKKVPASVRTINLAGEPLPRILAQQLYALGTVERVCNLYGPSEDTTYSTWACVEAGPDAPPIGRPVDNTRLYVLGQDMTLLPPGCAGELFIGGAGLARGYWNQQGLTAERFLPDPFSTEPGARMYRTGDRVRWRGDGQMDFLGRLDHQVKIRGLRIEPGEIDAWLRAWGRLKESVTIAGDTDHGKQLICYAVPEGSAAMPSAGEFQDYLRQKVPEYMVPATFVELEKLPLTSNGKLDRGALPAPKQPVSPQYQRPESEIEERLLRIWQDILQRGDFGVNDNFFDLGGHSLLLVRLQEEIRAGMHEELSIVEMFRYPTVRSLALRLSGQQTAGPNAGVQPASMEKLAEGRARLAQRMARRAAASGQEYTP